LPIAQYLKKQSLELLIDFVDLIHQKHARFPFIEERAK
jgi:hypothetical protein